MPLLKLWNSIRGKSNSEAAEPAKSIQDPSENSAKPATGAPVNSKTAKAVNPAPVAAAPAPAAVPAPAKSRISALGIFGSASPHAALCKQIKSMTTPGRGEASVREIRTVLEISAEDGSRAIAVLETLAKTLPVAATTVKIADIDAGDAADDAVAAAVPSVRYIVIDQFEMAGGATTLKQFHQTLRGADIRPQVYPEPIDRGLIRVAHTIGAVDLILFAAPADQWDKPEIAKLIGRVSHADTKVLVRDGDAWKSPTTSETPVRRAA
ncbi:hypothetical protein [Rubripirellula reticaptiva]|uniref:Uncharacterized protein n=1 Tax=Rubripirellula reticaptiva TaxID=2528013 RepID=A0A5C6F4K1_9BACT|nr:hypothetical protein [Rubripirellula reticaptiva]TWU56032.1 hypothetical protein Poly59_23360 [Rubripirellula reticaptiva]